MSNTINFGIDLGTTNSTIAKSSEGKVEVFRNPLSQKETLPSVVAYRKNRILVGDKAREYVERDPDNVVGTFKRKMGTSVRYHIKSTGESVSPVQLSAQVLMELKNFVHTGEQVKSTVLTIPASFDTVQSNATKEAGFQAGFSHVVLLQEPIAASLAYVNRNEDREELKDGQWLVYDLGGGTFDVALVNVQEGEMRVIDHEGNNFLGGADFDALIVEHLIAPHLEQEGKFENLVSEMKSASGKYNRLWFQLQHKAEEAKIILSSHEATEIEFEVEDDEGEELDILLTIKRSDFESLIQPYITLTIEMVQKILARNNLTGDEIEFVLMVGGSTYIPMVRNRVGEELDVTVNCNIDPTTAVGIGAAHYAATRVIKEDPEKTASVSASEAELDVKMAYQKASNEEREYFTAVIKGKFEGLFYRIIREDKGYDSGLKPVVERIEEDLTLVPNSFNYFTLTIYDEKNNIVLNDLPTIGIAQGKFSVTGQPLPNDICLEIDDVEDQQTKLEVVFSKNEILPLRRTLTKEVTKTIRMGQDDKIVINVLEGPESSLPSVNQPIGFIAVTGADLERDLVKGSDVEITIEISESRDLRISVFLLMTDQEFTNVFTAAERHVLLTKLKDELSLLINEADQKVAKLEEAEEYETAISLIQLKDEMEKLLEKAHGMSEDDVTDAKFQIEDQKRKLAQELANLTQDQEISDVKIEFFQSKRNCRELVDAHGEEGEKKNFENILSTEKEVLRSNNRHRIKDATERLDDLAHKIRWRTPEYLSFLFYHYYGNRGEEYSDMEQAEHWIAKGEEAALDQDVPRLQVAINKLYELLPKQRQQAFRRGTGIG